MPQYIFWYYIYIYIYIFEEEKKKYEIEKKERKKNKETTNKKKERERERENDEFLLYTIIYKEKRDAKKKYWGKRANFDVQVKATLLPKG